MVIEFDPAKNAANIGKHGVSLSEAARIEWDTAVITDDIRHRYGEARKVSLGYIGNRLFCAVYVVRGDCIRIISLRKANKREVIRYAAT
jgi:uncharacterized DUF497 family protein